MVVLARMAMCFQELTIAKNVAVHLDRRKCKVICGHICAPDIRESKINGKLTEIIETLLSSEETESLLTHVNAALSPENDENDRDGAR